MGARLMKERWAKAKAHQNSSYLLIGDGRKRLVNEYFPTATPLTAHQLHWFSSFRNVSPSIFFPAALEVSEGSSLSSYLGIFSIFLGAAMFLLVLVTGVAVLLRQRELRPESID